MQLSGSFISSVFIFCYFFTTQALKFKTYASASDVWSFGVLLWEAFSLGKEPYLDLADHEVKDKVNVLLYSTEYIIDVCAVICHGTCRMHDPCLQ